jgi:hypothetical protein
MTDIINALWDLRTWFALILGVAIGLMAASLMVMSRRSEEFDDGPDTILILPPDEPMEQVDINEFVRRYS